MSDLYLDCSAGVAGDMLLGALVDAGASEDAIFAALGGLGIAGWELAFETVTRAGITAGKARVTTTGPSEPRNLEWITRSLSALEEPLRSRSTRTFAILAEAEAAVHGSTIERVHFHEVGALDAIVDIVGSHAALQDLGIERVECSALPMGSGTVETAHGTLPVPAPATLEIMKRHQIPVVAGGEGEVVTPTGAALVATMATGFGELQGMELTAIGYGAGDRDPDHPNVLRALVGVILEPPTTEDHYMIETNIDDMAPELIPYAIDALIRAGADDAWTTPIQMKKDRPGFLFSILARSERRTAVMDTLFRETTTFGCRVIPVAKEELERSWIEVQVDGHPMRVKIARRAGDIVTMSPEYEDAVKIARATGAPLKDVYARALADARQRSASL